MQASMPKAEGDDDLMEDSDVDIDDDDEDLSLEDSDQDVDGDDDENENDAMLEASRRESLVGVVFRQLPSPSRLHIWGC